MKNEELTTLKFSYPEGQERTVRVYVPASMFRRTATTKLCP